MSINPFNGADLNFYVLVNGAESRSLRPAFADVPPGWAVVNGEADRVRCLDYIARNRSDIPPKTLGDRLAEDRDLDH